MAGRRRGTKCFHKKRLGAWRRARRARRTRRRGPGKIRGTKGFPLNSANNKKVVPSSAISERASNALPSTKDEFGLSTHLGPLENISHILWHRDDYEDLCPFD